MNRSLDELFAMLAGGGVTDSLLPPAFSGALFEGIEKPSEKPICSDSWLCVISGFYTDEALNLSPLPETARRLFELSANGFKAIVHAWMSERPIEAAMLRFSKKLLAAPDRPAAGKIAADRGDPDALTVLETAYKVWHEVHRLLGFLRFNPGNKGVYVARCAPDHFALPAFGGHFTRRFGETPWAVIDEKRELCLYRPAGGLPKILNLDEIASLLAVPAAHEWEKLWKHYHKTINNESRNNPALQNQFIPKRYRKYLPEL